MVLAHAAKQSHPGVCHYARKDLQRNLVQTLPGRLNPLELVPPGQSVAEKGQAATLHVTITRCRIESHQWDVGGGEPDITFYETLDLRVQLKGNKKTALLAWRGETMEQIQTSIPTPLLEFPHQVPTARIAGLFSRGRVWQTSDQDSGPTHKKGRP
ncbi:hypothetical protein [Thiohalorhabdus sp.]|uniref:hypothetical protein n=1 Tax=Thiohalorhabdus sp. TaxID=3094134 RepID=UPI002FC2F621